MTIRSAVVVCLAAVATAALAGAARAEQSPTILFTSYSEQEPRQQIFRMRLDGGGLTQLTNLPKPYRAADVEPSPDGRTISFLLWAVPPPEKDWGLATMTADGGQPKLIARGRPIGGTSWSPDGRRLAFCATRGASVSNLFTIGRDGSDERQLTSDEDLLACDDVAWCKGGTIVFGCSVPGPRSGICSLAPDEKKPRFLLPAETGVFLDCDAQGKRLVFSKDLPDGKTGIFVANADGSGVRRIAEDRRVDDPRWSPDGRRILYSNKVIQVMDADGKNRRPIPVPGSLTATYPTWAPR